MLTSDKSSDLPKLQRCPFFHGIISDQRNKSFILQSSSSAVEKINEKNWSNISDKRLISCSRIVKTTGIDSFIYYFHHKLQLNVVNIKKIWSQSVFLRLNVLCDAIQYLEIYVTRYDVWQNFQFLLFFVLKQLTSAVCF